MLATPTVDMSSIIRSDFHEMPGLRLTTAQARRLWDLDTATLDVVLGDLVATGFLAVGHDGRYARSLSA